MEEEAVDPASAADPVKSAMPGPVAGFVRALLSNLRAGLECLVFLRGASERIVPSVLQVVAIVLLGLATSFANDYMQYGPYGTPNPNGLAGLLFGQPFLLLAAWAVTHAAGAQARMLVALVALEALWFVLDLVLFGAVYLPDDVWNAIGGRLDVPFWTIYAWGMIASAIALARTAGVGKRWTAVLAVAVFLVAPTVLVNPDRQLWLPPWPPEAEEGGRANASEALMYRELALLDRTLASLRSGRVGVPEFYLVALGGTGSQDVFMRETTEVRALFDRRFDTAGRSVILLNNPATLERYPVASRTALRRTLQAVGARMNRDEDVLVLFMTSHGAKDFHFELELEPWALDPVSPGDLGEVLDAAGIRNRVLIISACYSGGFIEPLAGPDTLVMSASRADRASHGCSHKADWTFFGQAFFAEGLTQTRSFEQAFNGARERIYERETAEGLEHSEPQIAAGERIRRRLALIERRIEQ